MHYTGDLNVSAGTGMYDKDVFLTSVHTSVKTPSEVGENGMSSG